MRAPQRRQPAGRRIAAHRWFFPAALALALAAIPLWTAAYAGWSAWPPLASSWHGHEMLFGYAQAVVAGFLLARLGRSELALLLCAWVAARVVAVVPDPGLLLAAAGSLFPLLLAVRAGTLFLPTAKKGSNRLFAPIFMGFLLAEVIYRGGQLGLLPEGERLGLMLAVDLVTLLLVLMGGRIIPAATAGALHRRGQQLRSRSGDAGVSSRCAADPLAGARRGGRRVGTSPRLAYLGYAWLARPALKGIGSLIDRELLIDLQHALTIGGLGTLSLVMILRTSAARRVPAVAAPGLGMIAILITLATLARLAAPFLDGPAGVWAFLAAAALWSIGAAAVLGFISPSRVEARDLTEPTGLPWARVRAAVRQD